MKDWLKKVFGQTAAAPPAAPAAAASQAPPSPPAPAAASAPALPPGDIWEAIIAHDKKAVENFLDTDPNLINATKGYIIGKRYTTQMKPAHLAAYLGELDILKLLHARGAGLDDRTDKDLTPLHLAARSREKGGGAADCADYILNNGNPDINAQNFSGLTPLIEACTYGNEKIVSLLLAKNARTDIVPNMGWHALAAAAEQKQYEVVKLLMAHPGIDLDLKDGMGHTALRWALYRDDTLSAELLLNAGADATIAGRNGETPLMAAAYNGNTAAINAMLSNRGVDVNEQDDHGNTALHWATFHQQVSIHRLIDTVNVLLARGAWVDVRNGQNEMPENSATRGGKTELEQLLQVSRTDGSGQKVPLMTSKEFNEGTAHHIRVPKTIRLKKPS